MSPLSPELLSSELHIALLPHRVALVQGRKPPLVRDVKTDGLETLDELLREMQSRGRAQVTLSHHHARLFLLPPPPVRLRQREMQPWLLAQLASPLANAGEATADWRLTWDLTPPGRSILVAAVATALLDGLAATLGRHGLSLAGARPWLAAAWGRRRLQRASGWYALLEPGRMTLLRLAGGQPVSLRQRQAGSAGSDIAAELRTLLTRESLLAGVADSGELWLERAGVGSDWACLRASHTLHELAGPSDAALALLS